MGDRQGRSDTDGLSLADRIRVLQVRSRLAGWPVWLINEWSARNNIFDRAHFRAWDSSLKENYP